METLLVPWYTCFARGVDAIEKAGVPVKQIHGELDSAIPMVPGDPDEVIANGGHLITWTETERVNAFLRSVVGEPAYV